MKEKNYEVEEFYEGSESKTKKYKIQVIFVYLKKILYLCELKQHNYNYKCYDRNL